MTVSASDFKKISPEQDTEDRIFIKFTDSDHPPTIGQVISGCHAIKQLLPEIASDLWRRLRDALPEEDYNRLHNFYVRFTLGREWG